MPESRVLIRREAYPDRRELQYGEKPHNEAHIGTFDLIRNFNLMHQSHLPHIPMVVTRAVEEKN